MNSPALVRGLQVLLLSLAWIACAGCASFSEGELPQHSLSDHEESITTLLHWFVLPWSFSYDPMERKSALIDNMVLNLVHDLRGDLPRGSSAQGSSR
ncbi:MAG: hypothetical protein NTY35_04360 [Planctomycetota bacterium]|nr:hypothetical protein [Planctomycetota bacterium]